MLVNYVMMIEIKHTFFRNILLALSCQKQGYSVLIPLEIGVLHILQEDSKFAFIWLGFFVLFLLHHPVSFPFLSKKCNQVTLCVIR